MVAGRGGFEFGAAQTQIEGRKGRGRVPGVSRGGTRRCSQRGDVGNNRDADCQKQAASPGKGLLMKRCRVGHGASESLRTLWIKGPGCCQPGCRLGRDLNWKQAGPRSLGWIGERAKRQGGWPRHSPLDLPQLVPVKEDGVAGCRPS
jgi:hypothetical protein